MRKGKIFCPDCNQRHNLSEMDEAYNVGQRLGLDIDSIVDEWESDGEPQQPQQQQRPSGRAQEEPRRPAGGPVIDENTPASRVSVREEGNKRITTVKGGCVVCQELATTRCFFCREQVCDRHTVHMRLYVRDSPHGDKVISCSRCAKERDRQMPSPREAQQAGMLFQIKPYHEWRIIRPSR